MGESFLRLRDVEARTGLKRSTIYLRAKRGEFPRPIRLAPDRGGAPAVSVFLESEINEWISAQVRAARGDPELSATNDGVAA
jgi:prophage regulatory protein